MRYRIQYAIKSRGWIEVEADDEGSARRRIVESESVRWLQSQTTQHTIDIKQCEPVLPRDEVARRSEDAQP